MSCQWVMLKSEKRTQTEHTTAIIVISSNMRKITRVIDPSIMNNGRPVTHSCSGGSGVSASGGGTARSVSDPLSFSSGDFFKSDGAFSDFGVEGRSVMVRSVFSGMVAFLSDGAFSDFGVEGRPVVSGMASLLTDGGFSDFGDGGRPVMPMSVVSAMVASSGCVWGSLVSPDNSDAMVTSRGCTCDLLASSDNSDAMVAAR